MIDIIKYTKMTIDESLLMGVDDLLDTGDKIVDINRAEGWSKNSRRKVYMSRQKKGYVFYGDFVIDDIDEKEYTGTPIKRITGSLSISGCNIENLNGIFLPDCEIDGSLTIEDCPNLVSLEGAPLSCKNLTISGCKKLKNLHMRTVVSGNLFLHNNGKKFKEEDIRKDSENVYVSKRIFCSEESNEPIINESEIINEAFAAPQLKILANALSKNKSSKNEKLDITRFMGGVEIDKIKSSQIHVYDMTDPEDITKGMKDAKLVIHGKHSGFMFTLDHTGEAKYLIRGKSVIGLYNNVSNYTYGQIVKVNLLEKFILNCETLIIVDVNNMTPTWKIRDNRKEIKNGATALQRGEERTGKITGNPWEDKYTKIDEKNIRYFQEIADENRKRYEKMLVKLKAERALKSNSFDNFKNQIDKLFQRYTALLSKILKEPSKYSSYDINFLNDAFSSAGIGGHGKYTYTIETGLFKAIEKYMNLIIDSSKGKISKYGKDDFDSKIKECERHLQNNINAVDRKLTELETL